MTSSLTTNPLDSVMMIQVPTGALKTVPATGPGTQPISYIQLERDDVKALVLAGEKFLIDASRAEARHAMRERQTMVERAKDEYVAHLRLTCLNCEMSFAEGLKVDEYADEIGQNVVIRKIERDTAAKDTLRKMRTVCCSNCALTRLRVDARLPNLERLAARDWLAAHPEGIIRDPGLGGVIGEVAIPLDVRFAGKPMPLDAWFTAPPLDAWYTAPVLDAQSSKTEVDDRPRVHLSVAAGDGGRLPSGISIDIDALLGYTANVVKHTFGRGDLATALRELKEDAPSPAATVKEG